MSPTTRKVLAFLLLFGAGLVVLGWLERGVDPEVAGKEGADPRRGMPTIPDSAPLGVGVRGRLEVVLYDERTRGHTKRASLRIASEDSRSEAGADVLSNVQLEILDPAAETARVVGTIDAREAHMERGVAADAFRPKYTNVVGLRNIIARLEGALPLDSPLEIRSPSAVLRAEDPAHLVLLSESELLFTSDELSGTSEGYRIDIVRGERSRGDEAIAEDLMELHRGGRLEFESSTGTGVRSASLTATGEGALQVRRTGRSEPRPIVLEAWEGARLELGGELDPTLDARHLLLEGSTAQGDDRIRLRRLEAEGDVLWRSSQGVYTANECLLAFDAQSQLREAWLEGFPSVRFVLALEEQALAELGPEEQRALDSVESVRVGSESQIHLEGTPGEGLAFRAKGPATVEASEMELHSNGDVVARLSEDGRRISLAGSAGVNVVSAEASLLTASFELTVSQSEGTGSDLHGVAWDGTRLEGTTQDGRPFVVTSPERLEVERRDGAWRVVEGRVVELSVGEPGTPEAFFARCDLLEHFDVEAGRFEARGHVVFDGRGQHATGDRLVAHGPDHMEMWGGEGAPVVYRSDRARARADWVEVEGDRLAARGGVDAALTSHDADGEDVAGVAFDRYELRCEELFFLRSSAERAGWIERRFDVLALGDVRSTLLTGERRVDLEHAERLIVERFESTEPGASGRPGRVRLSTTRLGATGDVACRMRLEDEELNLACEDLEVTRSISGELQPAQEVVARGRVRFSGSRKVSFQGEGDVLEIRPDRTALLAAEAPGRVLLSGRLPRREIPFRMSATQVEFSETRISAESPDLELRGHRARARHLRATRLSMDLEDDVRLNGSTKKHDWTLRAGKVSIAEDPRGEGELADLADRPDWESPGSAALLSRLRASEGFEFELGELVVAAGDQLVSGGPALGVLRLVGFPTATITTPIARVESDWIEFDPELQVVVATGKILFRPKGQGRSPGADGGNFGARLLPQEEDEDEPAWIVKADSSSTMFDGSRSLVFLMQEPVFHYPETGQTLRASWVVLWIDRASWENVGEAGAEDRTPAAPSSEEAQASAPPGVVGLFFDAIRNSDVSGLVHGAYFEGPVEVFEEEELIALADAVYFDLDTAEGYLMGASVTITGKRLGGDLEKLRIKARVIRHRPDFSLTAKNATITSCTYEEPHVRIVTGDLQLAPLEDPELPGYTIDLRQNRIEFDWFTIPLPPLSFDTDDELKPRLPTLRFGDSARFGQLFGIRLRGPAKRIGRWFDGLFSWGEEEEADEPEPRQPSSVPPTAAGPEPGAPPTTPRRPSSPFEAQYDLDASYLGSRGALVDLGLTTERPDDYWLELIVGTVFDSGDDRGYVRVPEGQRSYTRLWIRSQGWFHLGGDDHLITAFSDQSDPGVQSEFFEDELTSRERDESYVQWKRVRDHVFLQASVRPRVEEFRAGVEELPSFGAYRSRASVTSFGGLELVHTGRLDAAYLRRVRPRSYDLDGDGLRESKLTSPYGPSGVYPDGTATRDTLRVDTQQTLELPIPLGVLGARLVPFASVRGTTWSTAADDEDAGRLVSEAGARLSTVFWKRGGGESFHQVSPWVQYRAETHFDTSGTPHVFDGTETEVFGDFVEVGTRARFGVEGERSLFDIDLRSAYVSDRTDGATDGWMPLAIYSSLGLGDEERPLDIWYDGRFDTSAGEAIYSLFAVGVREEGEWGVQLAHHFGREDDLTKRFDAISARGIYRWTEKWEFEAQHSYSRVESQRLGLEFLIRRYGHDLVFELETSTREGEGTALGFSVRPRLGFRTSRVGAIFYR